MLDTAFDVRRRYRCNGPSGATVKTKKNGSAARGGSNGIIGVGESKGATCPRTRNLQGRGAGGTRSTHDITVRDDGSVRQQTACGGENTERFDRHPHGRGQQGIGEDRAGDESDRSSTLRARYDRELLAVLEEEQEAEGVRERALAAARWRANVARARAAEFDNDGNPDAAGSTEHGHDAAKPLGQHQDVVRENVGGGHDGFGVAGRDESLAIGLKAKKTASEFTQNRDDGIHKEADIATSAAKRLEVELARERREASERVMRVSEAYEEALRKLSSPSISMHLQ